MLLQTTDNDGDENDDNDDDDNSNNMNILVIDVGLSICRCIIWLDVYLTEFTRHFSFYVLSQIAAVCWKLCLLKGKNVT